MFLKTIVSILLAAGVVVIEWLVAAADPPFGVMQGIISAMIFFGVIFGLTAWSWFRR
jgi:hypothetical protein